MYIHTLDSTCIQYSLRLWNIRCYIKLQRLLQLQMFCWYGLFDFKQSTREIGLTTTLGPTVRVNGNEHKSWLGRTTTSWCSWNTDQDHNHARHHGQGSRACRHISDFHKSKSSRLHSKLYHHHRCSFLLFWLL